MYLVLAGNENLLDSIESWLALEVLVVWERSTLTSEDIWNPRVLVSPLPESDTNASLNGKAVLGDGLVVSGLLGELLLSSWHWDTDIQLSNGNVNLEVIRPGLPGLAHSRSVEVAEDEVTLGTDTVDWDTLGLELADKSSDGSGLWSITLEVVLYKTMLEIVHYEYITLRRGTYVGDVELGLWIGLMSPSEGPLNEVLSESTGEDGVSEGTILIEDLVDNVPVEDLAPEVTGDGLDVVFGGSLELGRGEVVALNPWGQLRVPEESVTSDLLSVLLSLTDQVIGLGEVEDTLLWLDLLPLHGVLWGPNAVLVGGGDLLVWGILVHDPDIYQRRYVSNCLSIGTVS